MEIIESEHHKMGCRLNVIPTVPDDVRYGARMLYMKGIFQSSERSEFLFAFLCLFSGQQNNVRTYPNRIALPAVLSGGERSSL